MFPCSHFLFLSSLEATRTTSSPPVAERTRTTSSPSSAERTRTISSPSSAVGTRTTSSPSSPCGESFGGGAGTAGGDNVPPSGGVPRGVSPLGDSLVTFSSGRKSPGCRAERLHRWAQGLCPCRTPRGAEHGKAMLSRSARISGGAGAASPA